MSKITVSVPPYFSPLLCPQKTWEKIECQIDQRKKHTYNIATIGPFLFLNPTNKKNYPFLIFIPNYTLDPLLKKSNSLTLTIKFPKPIPSITFMSTREDQISQICAYIEQSKKEIKDFLDNVKISENITSMGFDQFSENTNKPIKVIPNIQFMNGKWQLQTLYKEQAKELKTIQIEPQKIIALPCFEVPHKFGSNDIVIYSFFVISRTEPLPIYFRTPEIDEMIKWILFIYSYLHNSPNAVGAPFPRVQSIPIKKSNSNLTAQMTNQIQSPSSISENNNESSSISRSSTLTPSSNTSPKPKPTQNQKQPSVQMQKQPQRQPVKQNPAQNPGQPIKQNPAQNQVPKSPQNGNPTSPADMKRKVPIERKGSNSFYPSTNRPVPASQMNIKKPAPPITSDSKPLSKPPSNQQKMPAKPIKSATQQQQSQTPSTPTRPSQTKPPSIIPTTDINETKQNETNEEKTNFTTPTINFDEIIGSTQNENNNNNDNDTKKSDDNTTENITKQESITETKKEVSQETETKQETSTEKVNEPEEEKDDFQDFSFKFESVVVPDTSENNNKSSFPSVQFMDIDLSDKKDQKADDNKTSQPTVSTTVSSNASAPPGRARSFSVKRRNSSISSQALDSIRSEKQIDIDDKDDYKIPPDVESRIEKNLMELDKKYSNISKSETKKDVFQPPDYNKIISSTLLSMSTLNNSSSRTMQIKSLLNTIEDDTNKDVVDFQFVDQMDEQTVEDTLSNMSNEDKVDLSSYFKFSEYSEYDSSILENSVRPRNTFIDEFTFIDQGLRQSGSMSYDFNNTFVVRLCFLVSCMIVNGLKDFVDQSSTVSIVEPFRQLSSVLSDLTPIVNEIGNAQTTCEQASIASSMLIRKNLLGAFLREVKRTDNWASVYYTPSAMLNNYEFIDTFVLMLEPMLNTMTFNVEISSSIFKSAPSDDFNRYAITPLFSYLEINDLFTPDADAVKIISRQFEVGLKKSKKFLNLTAWDVLEKLSQDQRYSAAYYAKFANSINASKAFFGSSKSKLESWVSDSINSKSIHIFFMLVHINLTLLNSPDYYEESSLIDPFRANYIMKKLCKFVSRPQ